MKKYYAINENFLNKAIVVLLNSGAALMIINYLM